MDTSVTFVVQGERFLRKDRRCKFEHDNHDNPFLMNNVIFIFRTSKHNTERFSISFRARKNNYGHLSRGQCFFCAIIEYFSLELTRLRDLTCKLSTHFNYHFNKIQATFTTFKITFRSLV